MTEGHGKHARYRAADGAAGPLARTGLRCTAITEKWLPDALGFVLVGTLLVLLFGVLVGEPLLRQPDDPAATLGFGLVDAWGKGFWSLITVTSQVAMIVIGGYAVTVSRPVARLVVRLARIPRTPRGAVPFVGAVAMLAAYLHWAFSLVFAAILAREVARNVPKADYRALGAMAFLGLGTVWARGLFGAAERRAAGPEPVRELILQVGPGTTWQALLASAVVFVVAVGVAWLIAPGDGQSRSAADAGIELRPLVGRGSAYNGDRREVERPGDWLEHSPLFSLLIVALGVGYLSRHLSDWNSLDLNDLNLILFLLAMLLHWRPWRLVRAVRDAAPAAAGVLLQFPLYGGILGMIAFTGISDRITGWLTEANNQFLFVALVALYSGVLALLMPFWMLPTLAILGLKARDVMGYTVPVFLAGLPAAVVAITLLSSRSS